MIKVRNEVIIVFNIINLYLYKYKKSIKASSDRNNKRILFSLCYCIFITIKKTDLLLFYTVLYFAVHSKLLCNKLYLMYL